MRFAEFFLIPPSYSSVIHFWYHLFSLRILATTIKISAKKAVLTKAQGQKQKATRFCHVLNTQVVFI